MSKEVESKEQKIKSASVPKTYYIELLVGFFCIIGLISMAYLVVELAGAQVSHNGTYLVEAEFTDVAGLEEGSPVEIAGVSVGLVSEIKLSDTYAYVSMRVNEEVKLRDDDIAAIRTKGIIGDKYIKIIPGSSDIVVGDGEELTDTESAVELEEVLGKFIHSLDK